MVLSSKGNLCHPYSKSSRLSSNAIHLYFFPLKMRVLHGGNGGHNRKSIIRKSMKKTLYGYQEEKQFSISPGRAKRMNVRKWASLLFICCFLDIYWCEIVKGWTGSVCSIFRGLFFKETNNWTFQAEICQDVRKEETQVDFWRKRVWHILCTSTDSVKWKYICFWTIPQTIKQLKVSRMKIATG